MNSFLSITVACFNVVGKVDRLLASLAGAPPFVREVLFIDDGSTDATAEVLGAYCAAQDERYTVTTTANSGPGGARNTGLKAASGSYVWFVDADDVVDLGAVGACVAEIVEHDADIVDFDVLENGKRVRTIPFEPGMYRVSDEDFRPRLIANFGAIWSKLFKRSMLLEHAITFPERAFYEDLPVFVSAGCSADSLWKVDRIAYTYIQDVPSIVRGSVTARYLDRLYTTSLIVAFVDEHRIEGPLRAAALAVFDHLFYEQAFGVLLERDPRRLVQVIGPMLAWRRRLLGPGCRPAFTVVKATSRKRWVTKVVPGFFLWLAAVPISYAWREPERFFERIRERAWANPWTR